MEDFDHDIFYTKDVNFDGLKDLEVTLQIHKADSKAVLIMYPGADGSIDGYNKKYRKLAHLVKSQNIATVVRLDNKYCCLDGSPYCELMIDKIAKVIEYVNNNAEKITGHSEVDIYLAGVSAGAGAIATVVGEFPEIKKVLFIAPAESVGKENITRGLKNYTGELYLVAGENDEIRTFDSARIYYEACKNSSKKELVIIPECDHHFTGEKNGRIMANAFLWAFSGEGNFPSHEGGVILYD